MIMIMSVLFDIVVSYGSAPRHVMAGQTLFRTGDKVTALFTVISGEVALERVSEQGARLVLQRACSGDIVAEPSIFVEHYHCDAVAMTNTMIRSTPLTAILAELSRDVCVMEQFARHLAYEVQQARQRAEILSLKRLSERLDAWILFNGGVLPMKGQWKSIAAQLAVTPEALYRELAKRRIA